MGITSEANETQLGVAVIRGTGRKFPVWADQ